VCPLSIRNGFGTEKTSYISVYPLKLLRICSLLCVFS